MLIVLLPTKPSGKYLVFFSLIYMNLFSYLELKIEESYKAEMELALQYMY